MKSVEVAVLGAGLSGLALARLLAQAGVDYVVLEARQRVGGRIRSVSVDSGATPSAPGAYDLGPTWFWPSMQPRMAHWVQALELTSFAQPQHGDQLIEQGLGQLHRMPGMQEMDGTLRLQGGMQALVDRLASDLEPARLKLGHVVEHLQCDGAAGHGVQIGYRNAHGQQHTAVARRVVSTLPPRLLAHSMGVAPAMSAAVLKDWANTATWMAGQAKFVAVYDTAFWQEQGLSGSARSRIGPLIEVHDASSPNGPPALFGFYGVPAATRRQNADQLHAATVAQMVRLFGPQAAQARQTFIQDWADDPFTATPADGAPATHHPAYGAHQSPSPPWADHLLLAGSECAGGGSGGYLEGALVAAESAFARLMVQRPVPQTAAPPAA